MSRPLALALPFLSLLVVAGLAWRVLGGDEGRAPAPAPSTAVVPVPTRSAHLEVETRAPGDVCQGLLARPPAGEPALFDETYVKKREVLGLHIVASEEVSDEALDVAESTVEEMFGSSDLIEPLVAEGAYVIIAAAWQEVLELPEFECLVGTPGSGVYDHVCGVADRADYPVVTVNELDLVGNRRGPCRGHNILFHELAHLVHGWAIGPADYIDVRLLYQGARENPRYAGDYALKNSMEYFAEATQAYFLSIDRTGRQDRWWLRTHDPGMYELLTRLYGD